MEKHVLFIQVQNFPLKFMPAAWYSLHRSAVKKKKKIVNKYSSFKIPSWLDGTSEESLP